MRPVSVLCTHAGRLDIAKRADGKSGMIVIRCRAFASRATRILDRMSRVSEMNHAVRAFGA
jgi:hypothetical protein